MICTNVHGGGCGGILVHLVVVVGLVLLVVDEGSMNGMRRQGTCQRDTPA